MTLFFKALVKNVEILLIAKEKAQKVDKTFIFKRDFSAVCNVSRDVHIIFVL